MSCRKEGTQGKVRNIGGTIYTPQPAPPSPNPNTRTATMQETEGVGSTQRPIEMLCRCVDMCRLCTESNTNVFTRQTQTLLGPSPTAEQGPGFHVCGRRGCLGCQAATAGPCLLLFLLCFILCVYVHG
jgi:hypothetical protein